MVVTVREVETAGCGSSSEWGSGTTMGEAEQAVTGRQGAAGRVDRAVETGDRLHRHGGRGRCRLARLQRAAAEEGSRSSRYPPQRPILIGGFALDVVSSSITKSMNFRMEAISASQLATDTRFF